MTQLPAKVTTGDGLLKELYEVSAEYQATLARLKSAGTTDDMLTDDLFRSALQAYAETADRDAIFGSLSREAKRQVLINLATIALRWARTMRQA